jgi:serine/threonine-protein kinase
MDEDLTYTTPEGEQVQDDGSRSELWLIVAAIVVIGIILFLLATCVAGQFAEEELVEGQTVTVPDVVGMHRDQAVTELSEVGFDVTIRKRASDDEPKNTVLRQSPSGGTEASFGITVIIEIADGPVVQDASIETTQVDVVPYVLGSQEDAARAAIGSAGYQTSASYGYYGTSRPGKVMSQYPEAGTPAEPGTVVYISISLSEQPQASVTVPDVRGLSVRAAERRISDSGLVPDAIERPAPAPYQEAWKQWPDPGTVVDSGSKVHFIYGIDDF